MIQTHDSHEFLGSEATADLAATIFLEIPHGATTQAHLDAIKTIGAQAPEDWDTFYWCSTDQGAPEVALEAARRLVDEAWLAERLGDRAAQQAAARRVVVIRGLIPRHYIDLNRLWIDEDEAKKTGLTPIIPSFLKDQPEPGTKLRALYRAYHEAINAQYQQTCQAQGQAMQVHTYSPRSVSAPGGVTGALLRDAWSDAKRETWPLRPPGQLITGRADEPPLSDAQLTAMMLARFEQAQLKLSVNDPFSFHPVTTLDALGHRWPGQIMAIELGRDQLTSSYDPLGPWTPSQEAVERFGGALALGLAERALL